MLAVPTSVRADRGERLEESDFAPVECPERMLLSPDDPALDEFVARCLAQLRQVMDVLQ